jgi:phosphoribosyl 1,2-cyclic phosphodiesterase
VFLLKAGESAALIDCPGSPLRKLALAAVKPLDVGSVFITHVHADHVYGLPSLVHGLMLRDHVFRLFGSAETVDFCRRLLDLFGLREPKYRTRVEFVPLAPVHFLTELDFEAGEMEKEIRAHYTGRLVLPSDMDGLVVE